MQVALTLAAANEKFESDDYLRLLADMDGAGPKGFQLLAEFIGDEGEDDTGDLIRKNGAEHLRPIFREFKFDIPANATDLVLKIEARTTSSSEEIGIDNIRITATLRHAPARVKRRGGFLGKLNPRIQRGGMIEHSE